MKNTRKQTYRLNLFEIDLIQRLCANIYKAPRYEVDRLPIIYFGDKSDFPPVITDFNKNERDRYEETRYDIDSLGVYRSSLSHEGHIEIYCDKINYCSSDISQSLNFDFHETRSLLQTIVLIHEIGHWLTHWCHIEHKLERAESFSSQSKMVKETLAQLTVIWAIGSLKNKKIKMLQAIMAFLTAQQSPPYTAYLSLGAKQTKTLTILDRYINLLDYGESDMDYLLLKTRSLYGIESQIIKW